MVIEHGRLPSTDYFLPHYVRRFDVPVRIIDGKKHVPDKAFFKSGTLVVCVRYIELRWARMIESSRMSLSGVVYFMDDDILDYRALQGLPFRYQWKIFRLSLLRRRWLRNMRAEVWVSSPWLVNKYRDWNPVLVSPVPLQPLVQEPQTVRIFYHGTASHNREILWLEPIIRKVQSQCEHTSYETFGDKSVNRIYSKIPRVAVLHPMGWHNYISHCCSTEYHVGLAPLLSGRFNAGRSHTKFIDITRCRAAGIYSNREPFSLIVRQGVDGILVNDDPDAWVAAIIGLANDPVMRERIASAAADRVSQGQVQ